MSRLPALFLFLAASAASAQDLDSLRAAIEARSARIEVAHQLRLQAESALIRKGRADYLHGLDTARVGPFTVVAPTALLPRAEQAFASAWRQYEPLLGSAVTRLRPMTFLVRGMRDVEAFGILRRLPDHTRVALVDKPWLPSPADPAELAITKTIVQALPGDIRGWIAGLQFGQPTPWGALYRILALSNAAPAIDCFDGDLAACRLALALEDPGSGWERWYSRAELQAHALGRVSRNPNTLQQQCAQGMHDACLLILRSRGGPPAPLPSGHRTALLKVALEQGGPGALERLMADSAATLSQRLERAAGVDLDALLSTWRTRVLAARPAARAGLGSTVLSVIIATIIALLLAQRSTRWRAG